ncbi:benzyl alcohol O-benzoyltransferase-like [Panicum miliaceum]|uniref:Benzyl alcohol O-benzoyltransferase-like n=1 Tax=Panicum miliaceum TaxID=4540 RepID=A0A3L6R7P5_PANMI|nr:benzyl alcohol O-benzoyltransferase-like [Panicum miliaceum]
MTMSVVVTKSSPVLVGPSTAPAAAGQYINLSSFDRALAFFPVTSFHVFDRAIPRPAETVRAALSRALVHYFPVAGRVAVGGEGGGRLRIACTGVGVAFVAASADRPLADFGLLDPPSGAPLLDELAVGLGADGFRPSDPLLLVQVTEFACGGFVVAVTRNHAIADGTGFAQFMRAVGELARGLPRPSVLPVSCGDDSLPELPPLVAAMEKALVVLEPRDFAYLDITIPSRCVDRIKAGFAGHAAAAPDDGPCTVFEAVMAVLWQCRTRAVMPEDPSSPAPLIFAANVRKHAGAKPGYYGNCITSAVAVPTSGEVANGDINDVVRLIKRAKQPIPHQFKRNSSVAAVTAGDEEEGPGGKHKQEEGGGLSAEQVDVMFGYNAFDVTSWRNLGADAVDFGGGRPARVMCRMDRMPVPHCVACLPCRRKDGANVLARCVREEHVDAFLGELAKFT